MKTAVFQGSWLKIERAKHHINNLNRRMEKFSRDCYSLSVHRDEKTGYDFLQAEIHDTVPDEFSLIIGDALHNLKAALDFSINAVVHARLGKWDDHSRFPIRETRNGVESAVNGALIKQASEKITDFIVNTIKPYKGGNDALWSLHRLNILDKHRLLLPVLQLQAINGIRAEDARGLKVPIGTWLITKKRTCIYPCYDMFDVKITDQGQAALAIFFDNGLPLEGQSIIPSLHQLTEVVSGTLKGIGRIFDAEERDSTTHS